MNNHLTELIALRGIEQLKLTALLCHPHGTSTSDYEANAIRDLDLAAMGILGPHDSFWFDPMSHDMRKPYMDMYADLMVNYTRSYLDGSVEDTRERVIQHMIEFIESYR